MILALPNLVLARHFSITLRTYSDRYLAAENGSGGGKVVAGLPARPAVDGSRFIVLDLNHGELTSGDVVALKTAKGNFLSAMNGGGDRLLADKTAIANGSDSTCRIL